MAARIKIGLVGAGDIGRIHAQAYRSLTDVDLVIARGRNPQKAQTLAKELGAALADNFQALLDDDSVEAIDLCIPNNLHREYAMAAAEAGKATLCEKPIALTLGDAQAMVEAFEKTGTPLMIAHVLRFWPEYAKAREMMAGGALGKVRAFSARRMLSLLLAVEGAEGWRRKAERTGGATLDLQIHDIDFALWTFGPPSTVFSRAARSEYGSDDHVYTLLGYEDGLTVSIESSYMLKGNPVVMDFRAVGDQSSLEFSFVVTDFAMHGMHTDGSAVPPSRPASLLRYQWGRDAEILSEQPADPIAVAFENEARAFVRVVRGGGLGEVPSPGEALDALRVALASRQSCQLGRAVELDWGVSAPARSLR